jgi:hypothetical protein
MLERAKDFILSRRGKIAPIVTEKLKKLLDKHPNTEKVYLLGSYANGDCGCDCQTLCNIYQRVTNGLTSCQSC